MHMKVLFMQTRIPLSRKIAQLLKMFLRYLIWRQHLGEKSSTVEVTQDPTSDLNKL